MELRDTMTTNISGQGRAAGPLQLMSVQALRALAALMVAIAHASEEAEFFFKFVPPLPNEPFGKGVDLFFVISGFIIYYSSTKLHEVPGGAYQFIRNRFVRVVPLYFLFTTLMVAAVVLMPSGVKEAKFDLLQIISSYTFLPYARYDGRIAPILSLGWTLNYEVFFYALFAGAMALGGHRAAWICIGTLLVLVVTGALLPASAPAAFVFWTHNIVAEFAFGILIALAHERWGRMSFASVPVAGATFALGFVLLYVLNLPVKPFDLPRALTAGVPSAMMMCAAVLLLPSAAETKVPRWLIALGDSSYSLYLSHRFIQRPIQIVMTKTGLNSGAVYVLAAVLGALAFAWAVYLLLERPLLRHFRQPVMNGTPAAFSRAGAGAGQ